MDDMSRWRSSTSESLMPGLWRPGCREAPSSNDVIKKARRCAVAAVADGSMALTMSDINE
jgi:hypothetical protein